MLNNTNSAYACAICTTCTYPINRCQCEHIINDGCTCDADCGECWKTKLECDCIVTYTYDEHERDSEDDYEYDSEGDKHYY